MSDVVEQKFVLFNGKKLTLEEFANEKIRLQEQKIKLIEVEPKVYKTRLLD
jgi:hypothetical protein